MENPRLPDRIVLYVTEEDIEDGEPKSCMFCPIARALIRLGVPGVLWKVGQISAVACRSRNAPILSEPLASYSLDTAGRLFVKQFDSTSGRLPGPRKVVLLRRDRCAV